MRAGQPNAAKYRVLTLPTIPNMSHSLHPDTDLIYPSTVVDSETEPRSALAAWHDLNYVITNYVNNTETQTIEKLQLIHKQFRIACEDGTAETLSIPEHRMLTWWIIFGKSQPGQWIVKTKGARGKFYTLGYASTLVGPRYKVVRLIVDEKPKQKHLIIVNDRNFRPPDRPESNEDDVPFHGPSFHLDEPQTVQHDYFDGMEGARNASVEPAMDIRESPPTSPNTEAHCTVDVSDASCSSPNKSIKRSADSGPNDRDHDRFQQLSEQVDVTDVHLIEVKDEVKQIAAILQKLTDRSALRAAILDLLSRQTHPIKTKKMVKLLDPTRCISKSDFNSMLHAMMSENPPKVTQNLAKEWALLRE
ncbi:hypothetical protein PROFUN_02900 [Planoprotostelium fungivorum]|uniref:Uncharacterized protein n=1 Tax=Planoprotostelium fungivorum TaxID=1890364 RepID=A0A2P6NS21_9EUKA|nr:hypothetical protein PROFUN_02900 [Planoprotostelium fungivorum]